MNSKFQMGSDILESGATSPGCHLTEDEKKYFLETLKACEDFGLDFYPTIIQKLRYDEMSEVASYGGFTRRYPHWSWGMEYENMQRGYEYGLQKIFEMVINCLHPQTRVLTSRGSLYACQVRIGDEMIIGEEKRTVSLVNKQLPSPTLKIHLNDYGTELICTPKHKWRVITEEGIVWKEAGQLVAKDVLVGEDNYNKFFSFASDIDYVAKKTSLYQFPNVLTKDLAEFIGFAISEESAKSQEVTFCGCGWDQSLVSYFRQLFYLTFNHPLDIQNGNYVCHQEMGSFLDSLGVFSEERGIPNIIWRSSMEYRCAFLRGLFSNKGFIDHSLGFYTNYKKLSNDIQVLLTEMGIATYWYEGQLFVANSHLSRFLSRISTFDTFLYNQIIEAFNLKPHHNCLKVPYLQKRLSIWADHQENPSDYVRRARSSMKRNQFGINALRKFMLKAQPQLDIAHLGDLPLFSVKYTEIGPKTETIDIALSGGKHDFVANGFVTHNTNPCVIYVLNSNTLVDNITVVAHATGHNDFFKNNIKFKPTADNMLNQMSNHALRIQRYMDRWGHERVGEFIDHVLRIDTLIDPAKAWEERTIKDVIVRDKREYEFPRRLQVDKDKLYMDDWFNSKDFRQKENERAERREAANDLGILRHPERDIMEHLMLNAPLKPWQQDIMSMLRTEALYFTPQRATKVLNEGWASYIDYNIMARKGFVGLGQKSHDSGIIQYALHKMAVLGGKYSLNPYKLGMTLLLDIEDRWNKGRFGTEYENCQDMRLKEQWDKQIGKGKEKVFEVRKYYDDVQLISEFFTEEFCRENEFFDWHKYPNGEWKIESRDYKKIKKKLIQRHLNGGLPDIRLIDDNHRSRGWYLLQHMWDGRILDEKYTRATLSSIYHLWGREVVLVSRDRDGEEIVYLTLGKDLDKDIVLTSRQDYENKW